MEVIEKFKRMLEMNKYLSGLCIVSFFYFSSIGYAHSVGIEKVQVNIKPYYTSRGFIPVISNVDEIEPSDFSESDLQKMQDSLRKNTSTVDELTQKVLQLEKKSSEQESKIERLQRSLDDMKRSNDNLSNQVSNLSGKIK